MGLCIQEVCIGGLPLEEGGGVCIQGVCIGGMHLRYALGRGSASDGGLHPGSLHPGGVHPEGVCFQGEGLHPEGLDRPPIEVHRILWDAANKRAVRILLYVFLFPTENNFFSGKLTISNKFETFLTCQFQHKRQ